MKRFLSLAFVCMLVLPACGPADGDPGAVAGGDPAEILLVGRYFEEVARDMIVRRDSAMRALIGLTETQSESFWSIKEEYDRRVRELFDEELALILEFPENPDDLTLEVAEELGRRALNLDRRRVDLHEEYFSKIKSDFSPAVAVQWFQLQSYFEYRAHVELAQGTPLAMP